MGAANEFVSYVFFIRLLVLVAVLAQVVLIVILVKVILIKVILIQLLKCESLSSKPVDSTRNQLLLDVLTELVIKLQTLLDVGSCVIVVLGRCLRGREEVEEGLGWDSLLHNASLLCV